MVKAARRRRSISPKRSFRSRVVIALIAVSVLAFLFGTSSLAFRFTNASAAAQSNEISPEALAQIEALILEKESRTATQRKIDSQLLYEMRMERGEVIANGVRTLETDLPVTESGKPIVDITATVSDALLLQLQLIGAEILNVVADRDSIRASISLDSLEAIAAISEVTFIQPKQDAITSGATDPVVDDRVSTQRRPGFANRVSNVRHLLNAALTTSETAVAGIVPPTGAGSRTSEGDVTHRAASARGIFNTNGSGVKIGVLSDGVANLAASQALGDLGPVTVLPGQAGTGDEGTAMLEIVHDLAPGAELYFATALGGITSFAQNIRDLRTAGCDIIIDDVFYFVETPFQDGQIGPTNTNGAVVIQAVNDVTADGAMYFSSAGNSGNFDDGTSGVWEGDFVDGGATSSPLGVGRLHNFGGQNFNLLTAANTAAPISLYWSDPLGSSSNDYDLFRLNASGTAVAASSTNIQSGSQDPYEQISQSTANPRIVIVKKTAAAPRFLHLNTNRGRLSIGTFGQTHGHSAAANAFSCAAAPAQSPFGAPPNPYGPFPNSFSGSDVTELFSSDGPRRIFFQANGTPYTVGNFSSTGGIVRPKPDITAADGVAVSGSGGFPSPFYGTSAAAPHAGAIAALIKSANPALSSMEIRAALISSAIDIEAPGIDRDSGAGIIMAHTALQAAGIPGNAYLEFGAIIASEDPGDGNGNIDAGDGANLVIQLRNHGVADATGITATLTTATPGVSVEIPNTSSYADLAANGGIGNNPTPFRFSVASNVPCPTTIQFTLTVYFNGGVSPQVLNFSVPTGPPPINITSTLDAIAPSGPTFTGTTGTFSGVRHFRDGIPTSCGAGKPFPGILNAAGTRQYDAYTFETCENSAPSCITVTLSGANAINMFTAAYSGTFNPTDLSQGWLADPGASAETRTYSFNLPGGAQTFTIVVYDVPAGGPSGNTYSLNVSGSCIGSCTTPNQAPVAKAKNITIPAGTDCMADGSVDDGSFDPDGDPLTITQSPSGPYPLGTTNVVLTVRDSRGATSQATATVTVFDGVPEISGAYASPNALWSPNHEMVPVTISYSASDDCGGVTCALSVSSNEPIIGLGDGDIGPDWVVVDNHQVMLRAERSGKGDGRIYTITITCTDGTGKQTIRTVTVKVPKSQAKAIRGQTIQRGAGSGTRPLTIMTEVPTNQRALPAFVQIITKSEKDEKKSKARRTRARKQ